MITTIIELEAFLDAQRGDGAVTLTLGFQKKGVTALLESRDWTSKKKAADLGALLRMLEDAALVKEYEAVTLGTFHTIGHMVTLVDRLRQGGELILQLHKDAKGAAIRVDTQGWFGETKNPTLLRSCYDALAEKGPEAVDLHIQKNEIAARERAGLKPKEEPAPAVDQEKPADEDRPKPHLAYIAGQEAQEGGEEHAPSV